MAVDPAVAEPEVVDTPTVPVDDITVPDPVVTDTTSDDGGFFSSAWDTTKQAASDAASATANAASSAADTVSKKASNAWNNWDFSFIAEPEEVVPKYTWKTYVELGVGLFSVGAGVYMINKGKKERKQSEVNMPLLEDDFIQV